MQLVHYSQYSVVAVIVIQPTPDESVSVNITPVQRVEAGFVPSMDERSVQMAIDWIKLENCLAPVSAAAEAAYLSELGGNHDPRNAAFVTDLIEAGKMLVNSGTAMMLRADSIKAMIDERAATGTVGQAIFPQRGHVTPSLPPAVPSPDDPGSKTVNEPSPATRNAGQTAFPQMIEVTASVPPPVPPPDETQDTVASQSRPLAVKSSDPDVRVTASVQGSQKRKSSIPVKSEQSPFAIAAAKALPAQIPKSSLFSIAQEPAVPSTSSSQPQQPQLLSTHKAPVPAKIHKAASRQAAPKAASRQAAPTQASFHCTLCTAVFTDVDLLMKHIEASHRGPGPAAAPGTSQPKTSVKQRLSRKPIFPCKSCPKVFESKSTLTQHEHLVHLSASVRVQAVPPQFSVPVIHKCTVCGKGFGSLTSLQQHQRTHRKPQATAVVAYYDCDQCEQRFDSPFKLQRHTLTHSNEGRHYCQHPGCGKHYKSKYSLADHFKIHVAESKKAASTSKNPKSDKPFPCPYCDKSCASPVALRKHINQFHQEQHAEGKSGRHGKTKPTE